jgi:hypothetical protein
MANMLLLILPLVTGLDDKTGQGEKINFKAYSAPYFVRNDTALKGDEAFVVFSDKAAFDKNFGVGFVMGTRKEDLLPADTFDKKRVVVAVKHGNAPIKYQVQIVTAKGDNLEVRYTTTAGKAGSATFASPLIVAVDRGKYKEVVFIENGKKVGTAEVK